jgi:hypothetical protein
VRRSSAERLAGANALQVNQWPKSALQRPRAAQRQLAGSNRAAQLGPSQVDAVERGSVDDDLEVDVETGMLEAD